MASPKAPGPPLPPITDPKSIQEVAADDVVIQIVNGTAHILFVAVQPSNIDATGTVSNHRVAVGRVAMAMPAFQAMINCAKQLETAMQLHNATGSLN